MILAFALSKMDLLQLSAVPFAYGKYPTMISSLIWRFLHHSCIALLKNSPPRSIWMALSWHLDSTSTFSFQSQIDCKSFILFGRNFVHTRPVAWSVAVHMYRFRWREITGAGPQRSLCTLFQIFRRGCLLDSRINFVSRSMKPVSRYRCSNLVHMSEQRSKLLTRE